MIAIANNELTFTGTLMQWAQFLSAHPRITASGLGRSDVVQNGDFRRSLITVVIPVKGIVRLEIIGF